MIRGLIIVFGLLWSTIAAAIPPAPSLGISPPEVTGFRAIGDVVNIDCSEVVSTGRCYLDAQHRFC